MSSPVTIGVDLGGTKVAAAIVHASGEIAEIHRAPSRALDGPTAVLDGLAEIVDRAAGGAPISAVGIGSAGVIDPGTGTVVASTDAFTDWPGTPISSTLGSRLGTTVSVLNDVGAHALGESWSAGKWAGAAADLHSFLMVAVGTGVGGALYSDGGLRGGHRHVAGHLAHVPVPGAEGMRCACGRMGHVEAIAAGPAIERTYAIRSGTELAGSEIGRAADSGDDVARDVLREAAVALARAVAGVVSVWDPAGLVLGGSVPLSGEIWSDAFATTLRSELIEPFADLPIRLSADGGRAAIVGAALATGALGEPVARH